MAVFCCNIALNDNKDESTPIDLALENLFLFCLLRTFLYALIMRNRSRAPSLSQALASKTRSVKSDFPASAVFMLMEMHLKWILPTWHCKTFCFFVFYKHFYTHLSGATVLREPISDTSWVRILEISRAISINFNARAARVGAVFLGPPPFGCWFVGAHGALRAGGSRIRGEREQGPIGDDLDSGRVSKGALSLMAHCLFKTG